MLCPVGISEGAPGDQGVPRPGPTRIAQPVWQEQRQLRAPLHPHRQVTGRRIWQDCGSEFHKVSFKILVRRTKKHISISANVTSSYSKNITHMYIFQIVREAAKKVIISGMATKRGEGGKGLVTKKKFLF